MDSADTANGYLGGVEIFAASALHPEAPYTVTYFDGSSYGGSSTYANGIFVVADIDDGDTVTISASKPGFYPAQRSYVVHADSVSQGRLALTAVASIVASPPAVNFEPVAVGGSATKEVSFTNVSDQSVTINRDGTDVFGPDAPMFNVEPAGTSNPCPELPATLAPGQSCTVGVTFTPTSAGMKSANITLNTGARNHHVALSGYAFEYTPPPAISSIVPNNAVEGTSVTIKGSNFDLIPQNNKVEFNGVWAEVTGATANALYVTVPYGAVSGPIDVTTGGGSASSPIPFTVITDITFSGRVTNSAGEGVAGAIVSIADDEDMLTTTDDAGNFVFTGLPYGMPFSVEITSDGFVPSYTRVFTATSNIV